MRIGSTKSCIVEPAEEGPDMAWAWEMLVDSMVLVISFSTGGFRERFKVLWSS